MDATEMVILRGVHEGQSLRDIGDRAMLSQEGVRQKLLDIRDAHPHLLIQGEKGKAHNWKLTDQGLAYLRANGMLPTEVFRS